MRFSTKRKQYERPQLTQKYGIESVDALIKHLQQILNYQSHFHRLTKINKLKKQIQFLKEEKYRFILKNNQEIVNHLINCVDQQKQQILSEFQLQKQQNLSEIMEQIKNIQLQMQNQHKQQYIKLQQQMNLKLSELQGKPTHNITNYFQQIHSLCKHQLYYQAEGVKQLLQKQFIKQQQNKYYQWKKYRQKQIKILIAKQQKQKNALKDRLQSLIQNQLKCKNDDYIRLIKKIQIKKRKIQQNLTTNNSTIQKQIQSLASSRYTSKQLKKDQWSQKLSKICCQAQLQPNPLSVDHPHAWNTPQKQKPITNGNQ